MTDTKNSQQMEPLSLFYENRLIAEVNKWRLSKRSLTLPQNLGILPGMVVEIAKHPAGVRTTGVVTDIGDGKLCIQLEGVLR